MFDPNSGTEEYCLPIFSHNHLTISLGVYILFLRGRGIIELGSIVEINTEVSAVQQHTNSKTLDDTNTESHSFAISPIASGESGLVQSTT